MLTEQDNEIMCRVGPGTMMGNLMRQFWMPVLTAQELGEPDGAPLRVRLLGENLIAFRATDGSVGLVTNACPHRGASMFFGRNEEEGLALCLPRLEVRRQRRLRRHALGTSREQLQEQGPSTCVPVSRAWRRDLDVYGSPRGASALPMIAGNMDDSSPSVVTKTLRQCNWFQGLEGDIDTSHVGFLHRVFGRQAEPDVRVLPGPRPPPEVRSQ